MHLTRDGKFHRTDIWREGKWVDLWSVVHFLTGVSTALGLSILAFGFPASAVIAFLGFTAYELWEAMVKIEETPQNRAMDVLVGMVSFVPTFLFVAPLFPFWGLFFVFWAVLEVNVALAYFGWDISHKARLLEAKMRLEIAHQRERFIHRRDQFVADRERRGSLKERLRARKEQWRLHKKRRSLLPQPLVVRDQNHPPELSA